MTERSEILMEPAVEQFVERMGLFFEDDGHPRIAGRMFGFMLLSPEPCSLDDLAEQLQVSKASVSTNARLLEAWGAVERVARPGDRRDYYQTAEDMPVRMLERRLERIHSMRILVQEGRQAISGMHPRVAERMRMYQVIHEHAASNIADALQQLRSCIQQGGRVESPEHMAP
jgi:DNA-binding transcriptional regulator GbsR (MarR family)